MRAWAQWWQCKCEKCKADNWVNNGDPDDMTAFDVGGFKCWSCGDANVFDGFEDDADDEGFIECLSVGRRMREL